MSPPPNSLTGPSQNFLALCASGYYDESPFHRLIPGFMVQTGAPAHPTEENPKGGRSIWGGAFEDEIRPALRHNARGVVSMANKGPGTNGSQFFLLFDKAPHLDGLNTVFGKLIGDESVATLAKIEAVFANYLVIYAGSPGSMLHARQSASSVTFEAEVAAAPSGGILQRYQLLTPGLIVILLISLFILIPIFTALY